MGGPDWARSVVVIAAGQHGVVNRRQLLELGVSARGVEAALRSQRLTRHPAHRGVYGVGHVPQTREARFMAAVLASAPDAALSHTSAAIHCGLLPDRPHEPVHISSTTGRAPTPTRHTHRLRNAIDRRDRCVVSAIPATTIPRTILDIAETEDRATLEHVLNEAHFAHRVSLVAVSEAARRAPGRHALGPIGRLLRDYDDGTSWTRSELERAFTRIAKAAGLPPPSMNFRCRRYRIDAAWPRHHLAVELDGRAAHSTPRNFERDRVKQNALVASGWTVLRFTYRQVMRDPEHVAAQLAAALTPIRAA